MTETIEITNERGLVQQVTIEHEGSSLINVEDEEKLDIRYRDTQYTKLSKICPLFSLLLLVLIAGSLTGVAVYYMIITPRINTGLTSKPTHGYFYHLFVDKFESSDKLVNQLGDIRGVYDNLDKLQSMNVQSILLSGATFGTPEENVRNEAFNGADIKKELIRKCNKIGISLGTFVNEEDRKNVALFEKYHLLTYATVIKAVDQPLATSMETIKFWSSWVKKQPRAYVKPVYGLMLQTSLDDSQLETLKSIDGLDFIIMYVDFVRQLKTFPSFENTSIYWMSLNPVLAETADYFGDKNVHSLNLMLSAFLTDGTSLYYGEELFESPNSQYNNMYKARSDYSKKIIQLLNDLYTMKKYSPTWSSLQVPKVMYSGDSSISNSLPANFPIFVREFKNHRIYACAILIQNNEKRLITFDITGFCGHQEAIVGEIFFSFPGTVRFDRTKSVFLNNITLGYGYSAYIYQLKKMPSDTKMVTTLELKDA